MKRRGIPLIAICSESFKGLGRAQARALGYAQLPIAVVPHPFGKLTREQIGALARDCVTDIVQFALHPAPPQTSASPAGMGSGSGLLEVPEDPQELLALFTARNWCDGLPVIAPTPERVARMLAGTPRRADDVIATIAPGFGAATTQLIAANAVMAGCEPDYLPVLIAAVEAVCAPEFNLQAIQATTNPVTVWIIVNGPVAGQAGINADHNCLGDGWRANATIGRALRFVLRNIGGAIPGQMDRSTQGQPGKFTFCCAENETRSPWPALHIERGFAAGSSTVTVVGAEGTTNLNSHARDAQDLLRVIADTMMHAPANDYLLGRGEPWVVLSPEHAAVLGNAGLAKAQVRQRLWELSRMRADRMATEDFVRTRNTRREQLGEIGPDTLLPIAINPEKIGILVAGGAGTHSVFIPSFGHTYSVTREIRFGAA